MTGCTEKAQAFQGNTDAVKDNCEFTYVDSPMMQGIKQRIHVAGEDQSKYELSSSYEGFSLTWTSKEQCKATPTMKQKFRMNVICNKSEDSKYKQDGTTQEEIDYAS